uniref:Uncharacterized protein n=1 Tax=Parascaris equorum TaxID=6256 RepID=A0A914RV76_PAREQ
MTSSKLHATMRFPDLVLIVQLHIADYFLSLNPGNDKFERNKWLRELWEYKFNCEFGLPHGSTLNRCENQRQTRENFNPDDKVQFVIEAVFAIAHGLQAMKQAVCPNDTIETSWISRHSKMPHICSAMNLIDGEEFYRKYLLHLELNDEKMLWLDGDVPISQCSMPCPLGYRKQLIKVVR